MRRFSLCARLTVVAAAVSAVAIAVTAGGAGAAGSATLSLTAFPTAVLTNGAGTILATFTNKGPSTLNHVVVSVNLPAGVVFVSAHSSAGCTAGTPNVHTGVTTVTCQLAGGGSILVGAIVYTTIAYTAPQNGTTGSQLAFTSSATANSQTNGKPKGSPGNQNFNIPGGGANPSLLSTGDLAGSNSTCGGGSADASGDSHEIDVTAGSNTAHLTCTPITVGIDANSSDTDILFTKMPQLTEPAQVTLTFPEDQLPWPASMSPPEDRDPSAPTALEEYPNYPSLANPVDVGPCDSGPSLPAGSDACIVSIDASADIDEDSDAGTIQLLVQGSTTGDGGFHGR
jgi:uncharacterized repeat protein (TIGR01451 family)